MLSKNQILSIVDVPKPIEVAVPNRDGSVYFKRMNFGEALQFNSFSRGKSEAEVAIFLLSLTLCDESGNPVLSYEDIMSSDKDDETIVFLVQKALEINVSTVDVEQAAKNS